jgi:hypothetical protein
LQSPDGYWAYRRQWAAEDRSHGVFSRFTVLTGWSLPQVISMSSSTISYHTIVPDR